MGRPYAQPTEEVREWSETLGVGLIQPYKIQDIHNEKEARHIAEKESMRAELDSLKEMVAQLVALQAGKPVVTPKERHEEQVIDEAQTYKMMRRADFLQWMPLNKEFYQNAFVENQEDMRNKWAKMADPDVPFPH